MYESFFGLREKPFSITPNPRFIFLSKTHQEVFAHLLYGLQQHAGFIEITGEVGTGKTTILRALFEQLDEKDYRLALIFNPRLTVLDLLRSINREFGLQVADGTHLELTEQLNRFLLEENHAGRTPVLVIDEAQNLSSDVLEQIRLLSNLETDHDKLIQIVLVGQPELGRNLDRPELRQLNQRITVRYHLDRLDLDDTCEYIRHRLKVAECSRTDLFSPAALKMIYRLSGGLPRLINVLCDRACLVCFSEERSQIDARAVKQASRELQRGEGQSGPSVLFPGALKYVLLALLIISGGAWFMMNQRQDTPLAEAVVAVASPQKETLSEIIEKEQVQTVLLKPLEVKKTEPEKPVMPAKAQKPEKSEAKRITADLVPVKKADTSKRVVAREPVVVTVALSADEKLDLDAMNAVLNKWQRRSLPDERSVLLDKPKAFSSRDLVLTEHRGSLHELLQLNTPVLVEFSSRNRTWWTAIIDGKTNSWIVEPAVDSAKHLSLHEIKALWTGRALLPWHDPLRIEANEVPSARVSSIQELLIASGYRQDPANGIFDRDTTKAIGRFQADHGLAIDGQVDLYTLILLYQSSDHYRVPMLRPSIKG
jgi:general secretion pathway protein A